MLLLDAALQNVGHKFEQHDEACVAMSRAEVRAAIHTRQGYSFVDCTRLGTYGTIETLVVTDRHGAFVCNLWVVVDTNANLTASGGNCGP